jgi:hypothetical protein
MHATGSQRVAIFARPILLAVTLCALPAVQASAIPIQVIGGIRAEDFTWLGAGFSETFVHLVGPGFELAGDSRYDRFSHLPKAVPLGSMVSLSGNLEIFGAPNTNQMVFYGGQQYWATGTINIVTPEAMIGPQVTLPLTVSGGLSLSDYMGTQLSLEFFGTGTATADYTLAFQGTPNPEEFLWRSFVFQFAFEPAPVPEPTSLLLLGSGVFGLAARRRSARPAS